MPFGAKKLLSLMAMPHSRQAKRAKSRQRQESVGLKPNAELKKDAKAPS